MTSLLVNLDAMIARADFAQMKDADTSYETITGISLQDLSPIGLTGKILRKPDFQRETNHWTPSQVVSLIDCFINGDLIPSVILWKSPSYLFVIDGGHRLSVLKAWIEDDYGDGPISKKYFGSSISKQQQKAAEKIRTFLTSSVGTYQHFKTKAEGESDAQVISFLTRALPIQWVKGDSDKAEASFFKINTQGTPLDNIEESLLRNRKRPIAISARAIIRSGMGNRYWYKFEPAKTQEIENSAKILHTTLFEPEIITPIKTLDLPLGGSKGIRTALQIIIDYLGISCISQAQKNIKADFGSDDETGDQTLNVLHRAIKLTNRITGNDQGSLGLHPAIYYYGPTGVHSSPLFLGTAKFISEKISNNDSLFFQKFTNSRERIEEALIAHKELIATVLQKMGSTKRVDGYTSLINRIVDECIKETEITDQNIVDWVGLTGKILVGSEKTTSPNFSDETKSKVFIVNALKSAIKCNICRGYLDPNKSISYDHIIDKSLGGMGDFENAQMTHPYCNQSVKNKVKQNAANPSSQ